MVLDNANIFKARGYAIQGAAFTVFLLFFALMSFRFGQLEIALTFLPLAGIYLWPNNATSALSAIFIFGLGLLMDLLTGGPVGMWAFVYLLLFGVFRPDQRGRAKGLNSAWMSFLLWVMLVIGLMLVIGTIFIPGRTDWVSLIIQGCATILLFPLTYILRHAVYRVLSDPDSAEGDI